MRAPSAAGSLPLRPCLLQPQVQDGAGRSFALQLVSQDGGSYPTVLADELLSNHELWGAAYAACWERAVTGNRCGIYNVEPERLSAAGALEALVVGQLVVKRGSAPGRACLSRSSASAGLRHDTTGTMPRSSSSAEASATVALHDPQRRLLAALTHSTTVALGGGASSLC